MKNLGRWFLVLALLAGAWLLVDTPPVAGFGGFHDDTDEPCFGDTDPFCSGGGGGGDSCYTCYWNGTELRCIAGSAGSTCTITHLPNGDQECEATGAC